MHGGEKNMKLTIKEIHRKTNRIVDIWEEHCSDMGDCLKIIKKLDKQFIKVSHKFKYIIEE